jgi:two-component system copper resistance phosphate regulon response regulator CusR
MHILLVEDDPTLGPLVARNLAAQGFVVDTAATIDEARQALDAGSFDAVLLDLALPDGDGTELLKQLRRQRSNVPVIAVTARDGVDDRVAGLNLGADDYVVKPFAYREVAARLRALARRAEPGPRRAEPVLTAGAISLDEAARRVTVSGRNVDLSPREFSLLEVLLRHAGQTLTRDQLLDHAWPFSVAVTPNAVDAYVHYLRTKLGDAGTQVETVRGVGYRLADG